MPISSWCASFLTVSSPFLTRCRSLVKQQCFLKTSVTPPARRTPKWQVWVIRCKTSSQELMPLSQWKRASKQKRMNKNEKRGSNVLTELIIATKACTKLRASVKEKAEYRGKQISCLFAAELDSAPFPSRECNLPRTSHVRRNHIQAHTMQVSCISPEPWEAIQIPKIWAGWLHSVVYLQPNVHPQQGMRARRQRDLCGNRL